MKGAAQPFPASASARASASVCLPAHTAHRAPFAGRHRYPLDLLEQVEQIQRHPPERPAVPDAGESCWDDWDQAEGGDVAMWRVMP